MVGKQAKDYLKQYREVVQKSFDNEVMKMIRCGVCNHEIPINHACYHRLEKDGTITSYHGACAGKLKDIKPCPDCGQHRLLCDECRES